ncbi:hypothetical protein [Agromyces marinus]|uniref:hypothetical protein n=1 Tax=Agromyces marinus TaxID=1389020 RepID=UPI001F2CD79E|nr:hypothetical protein [Agromyces marinus]
MLVLVLLFMLFLTPGFVLIIALIVTLAFIVILALTPHPHPCPCSNVGAISSLTLPDDLHEEGTAMDAESPEAETFDAERAGALDLVVTWYSIASGLGKPTLPTSKCAHEATQLPQTVDQPEKVARSVVTHSAAYVAAAVQQLRALEHLVGPDLVLVGWTVTRTLVEHCSRVIWLLDPDATPTGRLARWYMELITSAQMMRLSAKTMRDKASASEAKALREKVLGDARRTFPDIALFENVKDLDEWSVGGEPNAGLGHAVRLLGNLISTHGLYDVLSGFTHPSIFRLQKQTVSVAHDGYDYKSYYAEPDVVRWQFAVSCTSIYLAAHTILDYLDLDTTPLEEWADRHPDLLSWTKMTAEP